MAEFMNFDKLADKLLTDHTAEPIKLDATLAQVQAGFENLIQQMTQVHHRAWAAVWQNPQGLPAAKVVASMGTSARALLQAMDIVRDAAVALSPSNANRLLSLFLATPDGSDLQVRDDGSAQAASAVVSP